MRRRQAGMEAAPSTPQAPTQLTPENSHARQHTTPASNSPGQHCSSLQPAGPPALSQRPHLLLSTAPLWVSMVTKSTLNSREGICSSTCHHSPASAEQRCMGITSMLSHLFNPSCSE